MRITLLDAAQRLSKGDVVAVPTETVYGLAASIKQPNAIRKIFSYKKRPQDNPLIVHIASLKQLRSLIAHLPASFKKIKHLWPGPLTIVFKANRKSVPSIVRAGLGTVAIRFPKHPDFQKLIKRAGPLAAPSANLSGRPSATRYQHVESDFGSDFPILIGSHPKFGIESTVISLSDQGWSYLRSGAISEAKLTKLLGSAQSFKSQTKAARTPGAKYRHYSPTAKLKLHLKPITSNSNIHADAVLGFDDTRTSLPLLSLGKRNAYRSNLSRLYKKLRELDDRQFQFVAVDAHFAEQGLGITLMERLTKAASSVT